MVGAYQGDFDMSPLAPLDLRGPIEVDPRLVDLAMQLFGTDPDDPIDPLLGIDPRDLAVNPQVIQDMDPLFVDRPPFGGRPIPFIG
jgi:hypothetical protein